MTLTINTNRNNVGQLVTNICINNIDNNGFSLIYGKNGNDVSISLSSNEIEKVKSSERRRKSKRKSTRKDKNKDIIKTSPPVVEKTMNINNESDNNVSPEVIESFDMNTNDDIPSETIPQKRSLQNYLNNKQYSYGYNWENRVQGITC
jgi:hypothetical protein